MKYNFDEIIDREGTKSAKYNHESFNISEDALPLWVADMDFRTAPEVIKALTDTAEHGIFGYSSPDKGYVEAVLNWQKDRFGYEAKEEEIVPTPGVVFAVAHAVRALTEPGESIIIQEPVYYPFRNVIERNNRITVNSPLKEDDGFYSIDFEDFERKIIENDVKMFILSNPHNPVGRVFTKEELKKLAEICLKHDVIIVSDEIHADFVFAPNEHTVMASLGDDVAEATVMCTAPSKTFNLAGLQTSNIFIKDEDKRELFKNEMQKSGLGSISLPAFNAAQAAYTYGADWVDELKTYLGENMRLVKDFLEENTPKIKTQIPEGTYLMWLDCRELGLDDDKLNEFFIDEAKMWLDAGTLFGEGGSGYMRINVALPREKLREALDNLKTAYDRLEDV